MEGNSANMERGPDLKGESIRVGTPTTRNENRIKEVEYLTGWRFVAVSIAIVLSMFLVS
jgi:hypothetical protein